MQEVRFEGIVVGYEDWSDADRLVSFYTPSLGKIEAIARGVRYEKSKLKGHLALLSHGDFMVAKNRGRGVLTDAVSRKTFSMPHEHPELIYLMLSIAEMYRTYLFPYLTDELLWDLLQESLDRLGRNTGEVSRERAAISREIFQDFSRRFLEYLGYGAPLVGSEAAFFRIQDSLLANAEISGPTFSGIWGNFLHLSAA